MGRIDEKHIVSKQRVAAHGEVYTPRRIVNAMLDLVKSQTERIDSRFLEPACGTGNFLAEILARKLRVVEKRYRRSQLEYERSATLAVTSIYGIDILEDNVHQCRHRLAEIFDEYYLRLFPKTARDESRESVREILNRNIIHGDALSLKTVGDDPEPIVFTEWSPVNGSMVKRRDFTFSELLDPEDGPGQMSLLEERTHYAGYTDLGSRAFIPTPVKDYPLVHFLKIGATAHDGD
jgi:SAM-dependent methyltransferase